jgi:hypothetical protein
MLRRGVRGGDVHARGLMVLALAALLTLAGCAAQGEAQSTPAATATATHAVATATATVPTTPTPTPLVITDLNTFKQQLSNAITGNHWSTVKAMLSPTFSFQTQTAGSDLLMPDAATHLATSLNAGNPWSVGADYFLSIHSCYAGTTPLAQVIGYVGNNNHYILLGIEEPAGQSAWYVAWGFEDPQGPYDDCITGP